MPQNDHRYEPKAHIKATIDSGPPKAMLRPPRAPAARAARREAQAEAAVSDIKMIENIAREMTRPPSLSVLERKGPMSLNTNQRRKELQRIDYENQKLLRRLENQKSCYAHRDQKRAYEESRRHAALARAWPRGQNGPNGQNAPQGVRSAPERMQALPLSPGNAAPMQAVPRSGPPNAPGRAIRPSLRSNDSQLRLEEPSQKGCSPPNKGGAAQEAPKPRGPPDAATSASQDVAQLLPLAHLPQPMQPEVEEAADESMCEDLPRDLTPSHVEEDLPKDPGPLAEAVPHEVEEYSEDEEFYDDSDDESEPRDPGSPAEEDTSTHLNSEVRSMGAPEEDFQSSKEASALAQSLASKAISISPDGGEELALSEISGATGTSLDIPCQTGDDASEDSEDHFPMAGAILPTKDEASGQTQE